MMRRGMSLEFFYFMITYPNLRFLTTFESEDIVPTSTLHESTVIILNFF